MELIFYRAVLKGEHEKSIRDEPVDAELFQVEYLHDEDPEWMEIRTFLLIGLVLEGLNTSERKAFILKTLKFTIIDKALYRLGRDGQLSDGVFPGVLGNK